MLGVDNDRLGRVDDMMGNGTLSLRRFFDSARRLAFGAVAATALAALPAAAQTAPTLSDLVPDPARQCHPVTSANAETGTGLRLTLLMSQLGASEYGRLLLDHARARNLILCLHHDGIHNAEFVEALGAISADPELTDAELVGLLAHELQHLWQASQGLGQDSRYTLKAAVALELEAEANAEAVRSLVEWQLALAGVPGPLQAHLRDPRYGDIPRAFVAAARRDGSVSGNIAALGAAHRQWSHSSWRVQGYTAYIGEQVQRISGSATGGDRLLPRALLGKLWGVAGNWRYQPGDSSNRAIRAQLAGGTPRS